MGDYREAHMALAEARAYLKMAAPYFSSTVYAFRIVWVPDLKTLGVTTSLVCAIDPEWFLSLSSVKMRASCLAHECMHILRGMDRILGMEDKDLANVAADIPINDDMLSIKNTAWTWELPSWACTSEKFREKGLAQFVAGLTMEEYYDLLKALPKEPMGNKGGPKNGKGAGGKQGGAGGKPYSVGGQKIENKIFAGGCGSIAGNPLSQGLEEKLNAAHGRSSAEVSHIRKESIRALQAHERRGRGSTPDFLKDLLTWEDQAPLVPWREILRYVIRKSTGRIMAGHSDFSLKRPSKRSYARGMLRPGLISQKTQVALIEDSSGSMGEEQILTARTEACSVLTQLGIDQALFLDADADVASMQYIRVRDIPTLPVTGRGGTDFRPALKALEAMRPRPDLVIYFTDGDGTAPDEPPKRMEVVWCIVPSSYQRVPADWGTTIIMSDSQEVRDSYNTT
jgi:predicted metal-dependent peptidase